MKKILSKSRIAYFLIPFIITIAIIRLYLSILPHTNFYLGAYNIHHLFIGSSLLIIITILLMFEIMHPLVIIAAGVSSALIVDEITFLIATDGSDLAYFAGLSWWGVILGTIITISVIYITHKTLLPKKREK